MRISTGVTIVCLAAAAGLAAHVLASAPDHSGSARDFSVIVALLAVAKLFGGRFLPSARALGCIVAISAGTALGWPYLESGIHVPLADLVTTALWLFPVLCVALLSIFAFASVAFAIVAGFIASAIVSSSRANASARITHDNAISKYQGQAVEFLRRRGPPVLRVFPALST